MASKSFCTKTLKTDHLELNFKLNKSSLGVKKLPFIYPLDRLHHNFASLFKNQILAPSFLKDAFSDHKVDVTRSQLPFHVFTTVASNLWVESPSTGKKKIKDFTMNINDSKMQIFAGDYIKFSTKELKTAKIDNFGVDLENFLEPTATEEQAHKIFLGGEEAMKLAISKFLKSLKSHCKDSMKQFSAFDNKEYQIGGNVEVSYFTLYIPLFLLMFGNFGLTNRVAINGITGNTTGPIIISPLRLGILIFAMIVLYLYFTSPKYRELDSIVGQAVATIPMIATVVLTIFYFVAKRQIKSSLRQHENEFQKFYQKVQQNQRRTFYQNWFLHQNAKEMEYHKWLRQNGYEDYLRRFDDAYNTNKHSQNTKQSYRRREANYSQSEDTNESRVGVRKLYGVLGVARDATAKEVEVAFKQLTKKWHPDKFTHKKEEEKRTAEVRFNNIMTAYNILRDSGKRRQYDLTGETDT